MVLILLDKDERELVQGDKVGFTELGICVETHCTQDCILEILCRPFGT